MATITHRGYAIVEGITGTFDVITYPVAQSAKVNANWEEEIVKDAHGADMAWLARNLHYLSDYAFKIVDQTAAPGSTAAHAKAGAAIIAPLATVTLSGFDVAAFNGAWQNVSGQDIDLGNTKVADMNVKLRRYDDATQATASTTTPG